MLRWDSQMSFHGVISVPSPAQPPCTVQWRPPHQPQSLPKLPPVLEFPTDPSINLFMVLEPPTSAILCPSQVFLSTISSSCPKSLSTYTIFPMLTFLLHSSPSSSPGPSGPTPIVPLCFFAAATTRFWWPLLHCCGHCELSLGHIHSGLLFQKKTLSPAMRL